MYQVNYSQQSVKFLKKLDTNTYKRIKDKIEELKKDPFPKDVKRVEGFKEKIFRVRLGDYRILYEVGQNDKLIGIIKIDKRSKVYT